MINRIFWNYWSLFVFGAALQAQDSPSTQHQEIHAPHPDAKTYIAMLDDPQRESYQKPDQVVAALNVSEGETVADVGAGSGYFTFRLANAVGKKGRVFAIDINPEMIIHLNRLIRDKRIMNVTTILSVPEDPLVPALVDRVFICDTWHHVDKQTSFLALIKKSLKPGGQVIMIDFQKRSLPVGPPVEMKIAREDLIHQMEAAGYTLRKEHTFLPYQYFLIFDTRSQ